jgi:hypothetical protein
VIVRIARHWRNLNHCNCSDRPRPCWEEEYHRVPHRLLLAISKPDLGMDVQRDRRHEVHDDDEGRNRRKPCGTTLND